jgi:hypothetical protein
MLVFISQMRFAFAGPYPNRSSRGIPRAIYAEEFDRKQNQLRQFDRGLIRDSAPSVHKRSNGGKRVGDDIGPKVLSLLKIKKIKT